MGRPSSTGAESSGAEKGREGEEGKRERRGELVDKGRRDE